MGHRNVPCKMQWLMFSHAANVTISAHRITLDDNHQSWQTSHTKWTCHAVASVHGKHAHPLHCVHWIQDSQLSLYLLHPAVQTRCLVSVGRVTCSSQLSWLAVLLTGAASCIKQSFWRTWGLGLWLPGFTLLMILFQSSFQLWCTCGDHRPALSASPTTLLHSGSRLRRQRNRKCHKDAD